MVLRRWVMVAAISIAAVDVTAAYATEYGAIAFSRSTGANGYSYNYGSRRAAERNALDSCRGYAEDCEVLFYFYNACGALAVGRHNGFGYAYDADQQTAMRVARQTCRQNDRGCRVVRWVCAK